MFASASIKALEHDASDWYSKRVDQLVLSEATRPLKRSNSRAFADEDVERLIAEQVSRFRAALVNESRSVTLVHLFDYLLERSDDPRAPKEIEVAMAVFGKRAEFDTSQDSIVRVHVHRLRQRLESFNAGKQGALLQIPKGEYRLLLIEEPEDCEQGAEPLDAPRPRSGQRLRWMAVAICLTATVTLWTTVFLARPREPTSPSLGQTSLWKPIATHKRLPLIAAGDFYMAVESGSDGKIERLSMRPTIRSSRDLDNYLRMHPDQYSKLRDRDIHRVPATIATGAAAILPLIASVRADRDMPDIIPVSQISQDTIDSNTIIYIEHFSELGMLRSPVLGQSGFAPGSDPAVVKDMRSGRTFRARPAIDDPLNEEPPTKDRYGYDYGYVASYPGPSGNQILIISGIEDTALSQMIRLVSDKQQLDLLSRKTGGAKAFEALYQVRTAGGLVFDTRLVIARALQARMREAPSS